MIRRWSAAAARGSGSARISESSLPPPPNKGALGTVRSTVASSRPEPTTRTMSGSVDSVAPKTNSDCPVRIWSPGRSRVAAAIRTPLTYVPFWLSRSRITHSPSSGVNSACRRDTALSVKGNASDDRPMSWGS